MRRPAEAGRPVPLMPPTPVCTVSFSHIAPSDNAGLRTLSPLCNGQEIHKRTAKERRGGYPRGLSTRANLRASGDDYNGGLKSSLSIAGNIQMIGPY